MKSLVDEGSDVGETLRLVSAPYRGNDGWRDTAIREAISTPESRNLAGKRFRKNGKDECGRFNDKG
ncbi:MAG: hypothetical protein PHG63_02230 [Candidatus Dojkabacteria bacterium]|nr:hypothetical protein [Candidatus Dojkabacteria bacterium]